MKTSSTSAPKQTNSKGPSISLKKQISLIDANLVVFYKRKESGVITAEQEQDVKEKKKRKAELEKELKEKVDGQLRSQKFRKTKRRSST
jgi:hypothetical protein